MRNKTQWTPGPWRALDDGCKHRIIYGEVDLAILDPDGDIADVDNAANARLIAAAPEMAALLERFVKCVVTRNELEDGVARDARALLAKVKGG